MSEVVMPRLSDTMEEGELSKWLKNEGDPIAKGDILAEIETDKATMDLEAFEAGVLEKQLVEAGTVVPIGTPVAIIGDGSGATGAPASTTPSKSDGSKSDASKSDGSMKQAKAEPVAEPAAQPAPQANQRVSATPGELRMSPLARKIAKDHGLDPATITGSGPQGRVVRADVEAAIASGPSGAATTPRAAEGSATQAVDEEIPVNRIRMVGVKRLTESQAAPHFFLSSVVEVDKLLDFRAEVNAGLESQGVKVSVNDVLVRAVALALRQHPEANASWGGDKIVRHGRVNIGIAVATDAGLLVPVVHDADRNQLAEIAQETVALAAKAKGGKLSLDEMSGGTFSVSNLGMFGIDQFTAVINPPEAAILAVGAASPVPMLRNGALVEVQKLTITLTVDHRVMDGAVAAAFLRDLTAILEHPIRMLL